MFWRSQYELRSIIGVLIRELVDESKKGRKRGSMR